MLGFYFKFKLYFQQLFNSKVEKDLGENAIAAFSFAGLTFPGGEMPARLICRPYFCRWKVTGLCLPVLKCH